MKFSVGYCDNPNSVEAGKAAVKSAFEKSERDDAPSFVLLFSTSSHDTTALFYAVSSSVGKKVPIYGGGAVGIITNDTFGYAGNQVGVALVWAEDTKWQILAEVGLNEDEESTGFRLGQALKSAGITKDSPVMMFYDAVYQTEEGMRLLMATWILEGLKRGLGFLPSLTGAGLQGDHVCTPTRQFIGDKVGQYEAMALTFSDDICIDSVIMHGCKPGSVYYTVTKADGPVILEINNEPAIDFIDRVLDSEIAPDEYPFFLLFGINHGEPWGEYNEDNYASRLCLGIDPERRGIVMFEPDMVEGTSFQLMVRSLDYKYMKSKVERLFDDLEDREALFAMYIDCAGRCAGYGGIDMEDAVVIQEGIGDRVPLLGLYTGVEIAPIGGQSRGLDWTGVFCLFSKKKGKTDRITTDTKTEKIVSWEEKGFSGADKEATITSLTKLAEQNAAKILSLDTQSIAIRHELEQKRRGFSLLSELSVSLRSGDNYDSVFVTVAKRLNAILNMQRTVMLVPKSDGTFSISVMQGYSTDEKVDLIRHVKNLDPEMTDPEKYVLVTSEDDEERLSEIRKALKLPYFISSPIVVNNKVVAVLVTGRMSEQPPFLSRLGENDVETVQAIAALLASVLTSQKLVSAEERSHLMVDAMPLCCVFWNEKGELTDCNEEALRMFGVRDKAEFIEKFYQLSPETQPNGKNSQKYALELVLDAFIQGRKQIEWVHRNLNGEMIPVQTTMARVSTGEDYNVVGYIKDLRDQKAAIKKMQEARDLAQDNLRMKNELMASVSHEIRTPLNSIMAMVRSVAELDIDDTMRNTVEQAANSAKLLSATIDSVLDFSHIEEGEIEIDLKPFSPAQVLMRVTNLLSERADEKGIALELNVDKALEETLIGDGVRFEQSIFNIIANGIKFTEKGKVSVCAYPGKLNDQHNVEVFVEIKDTGIGIGIEKQKDLFTPLSQRDTSYQRSAKGLGMGLAVSRGLVRLMGGDIKYQGAEGEGSLFTLSFVFNRPEKKEEFTEEEKAKKYSMLKGLHVLVAEDNPINQIIINEILKKVGIIVTNVGNGLEALEALEEAAYDIVLMDVQMPEMDGLTAASKIREDHSYDNMPILAMTAHSSHEHRQESMKSGMNAHLTKPIDIEEVYDALYYWGKESGEISDSAR